MNRLVAGICRGDIMRRQVVATTQKTFRPRRAAKRNDLDWSTVLI
jgi:hypothetical protein